MCLLFTYVELKLLKDGYFCGFCILCFLIWNSQNKFKYFANIITKRLFLNNNSNSVNSNNNDDAKHKKV